MLSEYIAKKLKTARYKLLKDGSYFGEIPGLRGVWANAKSLEDCRGELQSALEDWLLFKLKDGDSIPGLRIGIDQRRLVRSSAYAG
jgi:predicted RNase H-like HicB family nuclease